MMEIIPATNGKMQILNDNIKLQSNRENGKQGDLGYAREFCEAWAINKPKPSNEEEEKGDDDDALKYSELFYFQYQ